MPYYIWHGVNLKGETRKGKLFARNIEELDKLLLGRDIALIKSAAPARLFSFSPVKLADKAYFFRQLGVLLKAGVLLPDALRIVCDQLSNGALQERVYSIVDSVHKGTTFADALAMHKPLFTPLMIQMVAVGEATGSLPASLVLLADHLERTQEFRKKMRLAIVVPGITLVFFFLIAGIIFFAVIPHFAHIFASVNRDMPTITRVLVQISTGVRSGYTMLGILSFVIAVGLFIYACRINQRMGRLADSIVLRMPFIGPLSRDSSLAAYAQSLALLLEGGVPLVPALHHAQGAVGNCVMLEACVIVEEAVRTGSAFAAALSMEQDTVGDQELISLVAVAEESGQLSRMLGHAANNYNERVQRRLLWITTMVQPLFMIVIGLLVALLIFAVYLPIFSLANIIG